jgi:antitoxin ParD1/3/4
MNTMNIALPSDMKEFVAAEVKAGSYSSSSEFVRALIRSYQEKRQAEKLETLLLEAIQSKKTPLTGKDFTHLRAELARRLGKK